MNDDGRGPAWSNSLFEDNAEFGLGMRLAIDKQEEYAGELVARLGTVIGEDFAQELLDADQSTEAGIFEQRARVKILKQKLAGVNTLRVARSAEPGRRPGEEERLDAGRRRLGL